MTAVDELVEHNGRLVERFDAGGLAAPPRRRVAVLTCMDARVDPAAMLGLSPGDAHVIRNAGGLATDDAVRSILLSQRLLGTEEVMAVHHTRCGMEGLGDDEVAAAIEAETGRRPPFALGGFTSVEASVRETVARLRDEVLLPRREAIRGFVYDVDTGALSEVDCP